MSGQGMNTSHGTEHYSEGRPVGAGQSVPSTPDRLATMFQAWEGPQPQPQLQQLPTAGPALEHSPLGAQLAAPQPQGAGQQGCGVFVQGAIGAASGGPHGAYPQVMQPMNPQAMMPPLFRQDVLPAIVFERPEAPSPPVPPADSFQPPYLQEAQDRKSRRITH